MGKFRWEHFILGLALVATALLLTPSVATAQSDNNQLATSRVLAKKTDASMTALFSGYKGVTLGMTAAVVRSTLDHLKEKGEHQDVFVFSDQETAQVYYDQDGKASAISVDYLGKETNPPTPREVLGEDLIAKPDGSMFLRKEYPDARYWVSYYRAPGDEPHVSITIQRPPE